MEIIKEKNSRKALIGTILVHSLLLLLFLSFGMPYQDPPPENEGAMMINFGTTDKGSGTNESESSASASSESVAENSTAEEPVLTQASNDVIAVNSSEEQQVEAATEEEPVPSENLLDALNQANNAREGTGDGNEGDSGDNGNQGDPAGDVNSDGRSIGGNGIGYDLGGRGKVSFKKPENPTQEDGKVVVAIVVDRDGNVIKASPGERGSTTTNPILQKKAKEAALMAKFRKDANAPFEQKGTMTFVFILN